MTSEKLLTIIIFFLYLGQILKLSSCIVNLLKTSVL